MHSSKVKSYLFVTILTLSVSSFLSAYFLLDEILDSAITLGVNQKTSQLLVSYQADLKKLRQLDADNESQYKQQFYEVQDAMVVYKDPQTVVALIKNSYLTYFLVVFLSILVISLLAAFVLSNKVSKAYSSLLSNNLLKSKRLQELEYFDNWQQIVSNLAHEIKNPLTPIEMMVTNLEQLHMQVPEREFTDRLVTTRRIVVEEIARLKKMVNHFNQFSSLPTPDLQATDLIDFFAQLSQDYRSSWPQVDFNYQFPVQVESLVVMVDPLLVKQCFLNLVQNAVTANPELSPLIFQVNIRLSDPNTVNLQIINQGLCLTTKQLDSLFQVGYSSKIEKHNNGLGLAIVKKIILDHHGYIEVVPNDQGVEFNLSLPLEKITYVRN